jgi:hypothetical protein
LKQLDLTLGQGYRWRLLGQGGGEQLHPAMFTSIENYFPPVVRKNRMRIDVQVFVVTALLKINYVMVIDGLHFLGSTVK